LFAGRKVGKEPRQPSVIGRPRSQAVTRTPISQMPSATLPAPLGPSTRATTTTLRNAPRAVEAPASVECSVFWAKRGSAMLTIIPS